MHTLVLIRHAKSDWSVPVSDVQRPLTARGRRQAPAVGRWLCQHDVRLDLAVVSPATRASHTWDLIDTAIAEAGGPGAGEVVYDEDAYTFSPRALAGVIAGLPESARTVALVGHNPALEDLVGEFSGDRMRVPTASLAVLSLPRWDSSSGRLLAAGRPADGPLPLPR
ncbi:SixA phosphatase family protein [Pseudactinotalea sp. Z1748]|uniref:SixA phosphatase family protein n=1 Tax=Pseudactinotalea sp. Z1748 TaxID=3413027 RepID=UPI003C7AAE36